MPEQTTNSSSEYQLIGPSEDGTINDLLSGLTNRQSRQRLQALIAEWLALENLVVLTGAGMSVSCGGKTLADLEQAALATLAAMDDVPDTVRKLIEGRLAAKSADSHHLPFEEWLSYLANGHFIGTNVRSPFSGVQWKSSPGPSQSDLSWFMKWIGSALYAECALMLAAKNNDEAPPPHLPFLAKLAARESALGRAHLFTLNYDTLIEQGCELLGIQYFDGFTGRADARFDPSVYGLDIYYPGDVTEGRVRRFDKFLHLYKLHGSIHWRLRDDELRRTIVI